jgi:hypothetical protein
LALILRCAQDDTANEPAFTAAANHASISAAGTPLHVAYQGSEAGGAAGVT